MMTPIHRGLALVACGALLGTAAARAESNRDSPQQFLYEESLRANHADTQPARAATPQRAPSTFRRILMQRATSGPRGFVSSRGWGDQRPPDRRQPRWAAPSPQPATASVAVFGDRFGQALASGLQDNGDRTIAINPLTAEDAGLTRADFTDWVQSIRARVARPDHPAVAIVMLGSNDRQPLPDGGAAVQPSSPRWAALYGARVDALAAAFRDAHVPLIWVGLPSVHSEEISADFVRLNGIVRDHLAQHGAIYIDSWEAFNDETGRYSPVGPDLEGQSVKLRKAEGFGFTHAGARKLASFVESDLKRLRVPAPGVADITIETTREFDQALQIDVNAQIRREAGLTPESNVAPGVVRPGPIPALPAKPAAGPVISLTAPPLAPGGQLAGSGARASLELPGQDPAQAADPKPGRVDDFSWPKKP